MTQRLVADVGGTNSRLALFDEVGASLTHVATFPNAEYDSFADVLAAWLEQQSLEAPEHCCLAVAAVPSGDVVDMVNIDWRISAPQLESRFGFSHARLLNDWEAVAEALPHLGTDDLFTLNAGPQGARLCALGPGTGLGGALCTRLNGHAVVTACEPGHMSLSPGTDQERELFRVIEAQSGRMFAELLVSGPGLQRIYSGLAEVRGEPATLAAPEISSRALDGSDPLAVEALNCFCALLGSVAGDFVLCNGAYDGLYLGGGILPRMPEFLAASPFLSRLVDKGALREHLSRVPVNLITHHQPGLLGASYAPLFKAG